MTNLITFLAEADEAALRLERARRELEAAKANLEAAKQSHDAIIARADDMGMTRAKLKRLTEERLASLIDTGLANLPSIAATAVRPVELKADKKKGVKAKATEATEGAEGAPGRSEEGAESVEASRGESTSDEETTEGEAAAAMESALMIE